MAHAFPIKQGSLLPPLSGTIENAETGEPLDLSTASQVGFAMRASGFATVVATGLATYVPTSSPGSGVGFVAYYWVAPQTGTIGWYEAELKALFPGSRPYAVPQAGFIGVRVNQGVS